MKLLIYYFVCFYSLCIFWNILANGSTAIPEICPGELENGTYTESHNGTVRRYNCSEKHVSNIAGLDKISFKCDSNSSTWMSINRKETKSLRDVRCSPIQCVAPSSPENGIVTVHGVYVGDKAVFTCEVGYYLTGSNEWTCQQKGKWDGVRTMCRVKVSTTTTTTTTKTTTLTVSVPSTTKSKTSTLTSTVPPTTKTKTTLTSSVPPITKTKTTLTSSVPPTTKTKTTLTSSVPPKTKTKTSTLTSSVPPTTTKTSTLISSVPPTTKTETTLTSTVPPTTKTKTTLTSTVPPTTKTKTTLTSTVPPTTKTKTTLTSTIPHTTKTKTTFTSSVPPTTKTKTSTITSLVPPTTKTKTTLTSSGSYVKTKTTTFKTMTKTEQHPQTTLRTTSSTSKQCLADIDYMGNFWNQSGPGIETRTNCPDGFVGQVSRLCDEGGVYQTPVYNCTRTELNNILNEAKQSDFNATNVLDKLVDATDSYRDTNSSILLGDMNAVNDIMVKIIDSVGKNSTHALDLVDPFLDVADSMLGENTASSWTIKINQTGEGVNTLLENIDDLIERMFMVTNASNISSTEFQKSNLYLKIGSTASSVGGVSFPDRAMDQKIPEWAENTMDLINVTLNHGENRSYSCVIYKNISNLVPLTPGTSRNRNVPVQIGAPVISFTFHPSDDRKLDTPVLIRFQLFKNSSFDPVCSFWKKENSSSGGYWSSDGCWLVSYDEAEGIVECKCDHLTKFAVLLRKTKKLLGKLGIVLSDISMVGCVVSMLELFITIVERVHAWRKSKSDNLLKVNLCCTLLVADLLFTTGIDQTDNKAACTAVAVLLHFVCLAAFFTMLAQGLFIAYAVIKHSVESREKLIIPLAIAVYVISGLTVAVSVGAVQLEGYGTSKFCWLSSESGLLWAFIGPVLSILFINIVITTAFVCRNRKNVTGLQTSDKENVKANLRNVIVLMPVMGLTWVFGVLSIADDQILFQYLFAIFNVLQGFLIFIFNCCLENKIQKAFSRYKSRIRKQCKSSESEEDPSECAIDDDHEGPLELSSPPLNTTTKDI